MDVERHTKRQVRYLIYNCKTQLYKAFVISDVCNRSLCVIPCNGCVKELKAGIMGLIISFN